MNYTAIRKRFLAISAAALLGAGSVHPAQERPGASTGDTSITKRVRTALLRDRKISALTIDIETRNGAVQLSGFAATAAERARAAELARAISGVRSVSNTIRLT